MTGHDQHDEGLEPPSTYTVEVASGSRHCAGRGQACGNEAEMQLRLRGSNAVTKYCISCWRGVADVLNGRGHTLSYTNAAMARWECPGIG
jgi:hypothetical protein